MTESRSKTSVVSEDRKERTRNPTSAKNDEEQWFEPDFIYGGPFIKVDKPSPFLDMVTPRNVELQGTFKKSFAYYSIKERLPVILTKIIDYLAREGNKIKTTHGASDEEIRGYMQYVTKLKNDIVTNKKYDLFKENTPEAKKWNGWIENLTCTHYFTNVWVFTECYVYRRLREGCELSKGLKNFDPFEDQKKKSFESSLEVMCTVADKLVTMLPPSESDKRKADFITLLKICLWANKCDLSLSAGEQVTFGQKVVEAQGPMPSATSQKNEVYLPPLEPVDPFQLIVDFKDKLLIDDSSKAFDQILIRAVNIEKAIKEVFPPQPQTEKSPEVAPPPAPGPGEEKKELPQVPCPAKITTPQTTMFDIVCDNAGYELFADLCLAHFLISQEIVQKVRFHVKKMPWFVSDVTPNDFQYVVDECANANYSREVPQEPKPASAEGEAPEVLPPRVINSNALRKVAEEWKKFIDDGIFVVMYDDYWTYPHVYRDMKKLDYYMYRKLQYAAAILFKGDLNYRKLLGERNVNPSAGFQACLQGFMPSPILAVRTVKADLICGLPRNKWQKLTKADDKWMQSGNYGVIQFCGRAESLKVADRPCPDYGNTCRGVVCPKHESLIFS